MAAPGSHSESTHDLPEGFCEALAFYDAQVQEAEQHQPARQATLEKFPDWADRLRQQFEVEDKLLGTRRSPSQDHWEPPHTDTRFVPRYPLGVGGHGEVWLAHDPELDRFVAIKLVREANRGSQAALNGLWREAELTGQLEHPNIVPLYDAARTTAQGTPHYVMRVYGNRHLLNAISAFYARERSPQDSQLLQAIKSFHHDRLATNEQHLRQTIESFPFDEAQECDRNLREAVTALLKDSGGQSGRSLQEAIQAYHSAERQPSELRDLLNRFIDVCNAMAYAHSRGVIHRDLKPQNVMLGEFGETLVVDWGLAKAVGVELSPEVSGNNIIPASDQSGGSNVSLEGFAKGTLQYMSPEQAAGHVSELTSATDIYSLGGILFAILTGAPLRSGSSKIELLRLAQEGQVVTPSSLQSDVPKALEAICLKALSNAPADRYATANDLAADVGCWLADEPVSAWHEPIVVRAKRWVKGHQTLVGSTAAVVVVAVVALSALVAIVTGKNEELAVAYDLEEDARNLADANAAEADRLRDAAEEQGTLALETLTSVIYNWQSELANVPGGDKVRHLLLEASLDKLSQLATEFVPPATVDRATLVALSEMGDVVLRFGASEEDIGITSENAVSEVGLSQRDIELALQFYIRANEIAKRLAAADPNAVEAQRDLSVSYKKLGDTQIKLGNTQTALEFYMQAYDILARLAAADPNNAESQQDLSATYIWLGNVQLQLGSTQAGLEYYQQSLDIRERLAVADPTNSEAQRDLSASYNKLGDVQLQLGDTQSALEFYMQAYDILARLAAADPVNSQAQRGVSVSYSNLGDVHLQLGDTQAALDFYRKLNDILVSVASTDPNNAEAQRDLSVSYERLGNVQLMLGDTQVALGYYLQALDIDERLAATDPENAQTQRALSISYNNLGDVQLELREPQIAMKFYQQSLDILEHLAAEDPTNAVVHRDLAVAYENLADGHLRLEDPESAIEFYQRVNDLAATLAAADPNNVQIQRDLAVSYSNLADVQLQLGDGHSALGYYQQMNEIFHCLALADPISILAQRDLSVSNGMLGGVYLHLSEPQLALACFQRAHDIFVRLATVDPANATTQWDLAISHYKLGTTCRALLDFDRAQSHYVTAIDVLAGMIENDQNAEQSQQRMTFLQNELRIVEREAAQVKVVLADWDTFLTEPGARSRLSLRITHLARTSRFDEIPQAAAMLRVLDSENPTNLYNAACGYALCANAIYAAEEGSLTRNQQTQRQEYIDLALACLRESIAAGWSDFDHMQQDPDLVVLRDLREFEEVLHTPPPPPLAK